MKVACEYGTALGELVTVGAMLHTDLTRQEMTEEGIKPSIHISCLDLMVASEACELPDAPMFGDFMVDAFDLLTEEAEDAETAEIVAEQLELWAKEIRAKFAKQA